MRYTLRKTVKIRRSRINYAKHKLNVLAYQKSKKKTKRQEIKLRKQLLGFLVRLIQSEQRKKGKIRKRFR